MAIVGIRELSQYTTRVLRKLERTGEPVIVTRHGHPVGVLTKADETELESVILATAPEHRKRSRRARENDAAGLGRGLAEVAAERGIALPAEAGGAGTAPDLEGSVHSVIAAEFAPMSKVLSGSLEDEAVAEETDKAIEKVVAALDDAVFAAGDPEAEPEDALEASEQMASAVRDLWTSELIEAQEEAPPARKDVSRFRDDAVGEVTRIVVEEGGDSISKQAYLLKGVSGMARSKLIVKHGHKGSILTGGARRFRANFGRKGLAKRSNLRGRRKKRAGA